MKNKIIILLLVILTSCDFIGSNETNNVSSQIEVNSTNSQMTSEGMTQTPVIFDSNTEESQICEEEIGIVYFLAEDDISKSIYVIYQDEEPRIISKDLYVKQIIGFSHTLDSFIFQDLEGFIFGINLLDLSIEQISKKQIDISGYDLSHDGTKIVFSNTPDESDTELFVYNLITSELIQITDNEKSDLFPTWDPYGDNISYVYNEGVFSNVFIMNLDEKIPNQITDSKSNDFAYVNWSPDGNNILYASTNPRKELFIYNLDDHLSYSVTNTPNYRKSGFQWSPNNEEIAFIEQDANSNISINITQINEEINYQLLSNLNLTYPISWSPKGCNILYKESTGTTSFGLTNSELFVINKENGKIVQLTELGKRITYSEWVDR